MIERRLWWLPLLVALVGGCGSAPVEEDTGTAKPPPEPERLGDHIDVALGELLARPRAELAGLADEWAERVRVQEAARREGRAPVAIGDGRWPLVVPVLREARYAPEAGFSLPPYADPRARDGGLALHLARYGDDEAARKLADPADADLLKRLDACRCGRTYPVEWARLVGLMLHNARQRLAGGDPDGATELVVLHRQLKELLDARAAAGPLGAALLAPGRAALAEAAAAWRAGKRAELADDADAALAARGDAPAPAPAVAPGAGRADVARLLGGPGRGRVIPAPAVLRGLDLLDLPLPAEGAQAVLACFDASDRLSEIIVTYRPGVAPVFPEPRHLARRLEDHGLGGRDSREPGVLRRAYALGDFTCEAAVVARGTRLGAFVRFAGGRPDKSGPLPRDFGAAHLDRGFEQVRLRLAPEQSGGRIQTERPAALAQVTSPLSGAGPARVVVLRDGDRDATARVSLRWVGDGAPVPPHQTALRLWAEAGPPRIIGQEDDAGGHLAFVWDDGRTRLALRQPYATADTLELEAEDVTGADPARRAADAKTFDRRERAARLAAGKPLTRLPRHLDNEGVALGLSREQVAQALPVGQGVVKQNVGGAVSVLFTGDAPKGVPYCPRQTFIRFDGGGRAVEIRTRYGEAGGGAAWAQVLLAGLKRAGGAPAESPAPWAKVWDDLPARKPAAALYRWQDDLTVLTCQRDAGGAEVVLRDASGDEPAAPPALAYLPRGPAGEVALGATRDDVLKAAGGKAQTLADGALALAPRAPALFDSLVVWLDGDRVVRVAARHKDAAPPKAKGAKLEKALTEAWGRESRALGWPARQDAGPDKALRGLGWCDERTRVRLFWQESDNGPPRLFSEWKDVK